MQTFSVHAFDLHQSRVQRFALTGTELAHMLGKSAVACLLAQPRQERGGGNLFVEDERARDFFGQDGRHQKA